MSNSSKLAKSEAPTNMASSMLWSQSMGSVAAIGPWKGGGERFGPLVPIKMVGTLVMTTAIILYETTRQNIILPGLPGQGGQPERDAAIGNARNNPELGVNNAPPRVPPPQPQPPRNPRQQRVPVEKIVVETVTEEFDLETFITPGGDTVTTRLPVTTKRKTTTTRF